VERSLSVTKIIPVIMSGGSGTRLWPLSTALKPKQFHSLGGERTMIQETALRFAGSHDGIEFLAPVIIASELHRDLVVQAMQSIGLKSATIILEPKGRNTAATAALAALIAAEIDPEACVLLAPADHLVADNDAFRGAIRAACGVLPDRIVTFGIDPTGPETGYGYILQGELLGDGVHAVSSFKEKPEQHVAARYLREGGYTWNSGVFLFSPRMMLEEFSLAASDIRDGAREALRLAHRSGGEIRLHAETFAKVRSEAVDRAVMEHTSRAAVAPCDIGWADIGSWAEVWRLSDKDGEGNAATGSVIVEDGANNLIRTDGPHVSIVGLSDLIVVANGNSILIAPRDRAQDVKKVIPDND
jgi:mannose-1-phosphate guanylyltransferase / mannose-6-phosphate isomerase